VGASCESRALASLAATHGSAKEISRLRLCFEATSLESRRLLRAGRRSLADSHDCPSEARIAQAWTAGLRSVRFEGRWRAITNALATAARCAVLDAGRCAGVRGSCHRADLRRKSPPG